MLRPILTALLAVSTLSGFNQSMFRITNVTLTEKEYVRNGHDATAAMAHDEGSDRVVIFSEQDVQVKASVKVNTHNSPRSSTKDSAVNVIFEIDLIMDGKKDNHRVEKIFYGDQERKTHLKEKFVIKHGTQVRTVTVEFDGSLE